MRARLCLDQLRRLHRHNRRNRCLVELAVPAKASRCDLSKIQECVCVDCDSVAPRSGPNDPKPDYIGLQDSDESGEYWFVRRDEKKRPRPEVSPRRPNSKRGRTRIRDSTAMFRVKRFPPEFDSWDNRSRQRQGQNVRQTTGIGAFLIRRREVQDSDETQTALPIDSANISALERL